METDAPITTPPTELTRLQTRVAEAPQDFDAWTSLVTQAEATKDAQIIRTAIEGLLTQFPLCYGYWQRLAKHENAVKATPSASADFATLEHGVEAISHSHELWTFYAMEAMKQEPPNVELIRRSDNTCELHTERMNIQVRTPEKCCAHYC
jgi:hypothetical protein